MTDGDACYDREYTFFASVGAVHEGTHDILPGPADCPCREPSQDVQPVPEALPAGVPRRGRPLLLLKEEGNGGSFFTPHQGRAV
jgi:hypothetical protein